MCSQLDDMTNPQYAEVWCSECPEPATGDDAKCDTHRLCAVEGQSADGRTWSCSRPKGHSHPTLPSWHVGRDQIGRPVKMITPVPA